MQVTLQTKIYFGACLAINIYNAYANPVRSITAFAFGVFAGTWMGQRNLYDAQNGHQTGNNLGMGWNSGQDLEIRKNAVDSLANSMPGLLTTAIQLVALGLITKKIQLPSGWDPRIGTYFCDFAALDLGYAVGNFFQLDILRKSTDRQLQKLLDQTTI
ncbi:MAG TPA: hypothetical protein VHK67_00425 [Rhabdochlamydiaceae bacterium]|jgi:hypothetical protein|nr:hypothetical protein [Rhabdochlamydiaceae bacterium]